MPLKVCSSCGEKCGPRSRKCKKCDASFAFKVKKKKVAVSKKIEDWQELQPGDQIKVSGGPVWIGRDSIETSMGYNGTYSVIELDTNGILARGIDKFSGFCHIWMGEEKISPAGIIKRPHRVFKLRGRTECLS